MQSFSKKEVAIIVLFFVLYIPERRQAERRQIKSLSADWPLDLGKYFYTIDIAPGYEMEDEEYEVIGESGGNLIVRKHNESDCEEAQRLA